MRRKGFSITGRVQGVGFRPFVYRLAGRYALSGLVRNSPEGVWLEIQGTDEGLAAFALALRAELPPLAGIASCRERELPALAGESGFSIAASGEGGEPEALIGPDTATCPDCLRDILTPGDRRFRYPFTNCTNCGPRYSLTAGLPYDRDRTSMSCFPLCRECAREYADPGDRRFHAQPNACPLCGPRLQLIPPPRASSPPEEALRELARRLLAGRIAAIKGLGGFHLACDALETQAVARLRAAKRRPHKPLAVMVVDLEAASTLARLGSLEKRLLESPERPIVLCTRLQDSPLSGLIAPDGRQVGVMLPYTPLHHLLLRDCAELRPDRPAALVMTSGNREDEPIALGNREALERLDGLAEDFLFHDRDILVRVDDSVIRPAQSGEDPESIFFRRARGFVPLPLPLPESEGAPCALGLGAELKNTVCLSRGSEAFVGQHIGDLRNQRAGVFQEECALHLAELLQVNPQIQVADAHPDFHYGAARENLPLLRLPHHFAHALAVLAENRQYGPALALTLDGAGFAPAEINPEGHIWGGELLFVDKARPGRAPEITRLGSLAPLDLPGGEAAVRAPWRIAQALILRLGLSGDAPLPWLLLEEKTAVRIPDLLRLGLNSPRSSGAGRLFDAVSALLGLCLETSYEGQAAVRLEEAQYYGLAAPLPCLELYADFAAGRALRLLCPVLQALEDNPGPGPRLILDTHVLFRALYEAARPPLDEARRAMLARAFHWSLAEGLADLALAGSRISGTSLVGLSGGVMQNLSLHLLLREKLRRRGLIPLSHKQLPPGDACIAYGQVVWAVMGR
ncbi:MAG: carbamoyltransferase HypF [Desulfovibrionaceae bacterium]|nr:carbamoyltransferase HypF [Desulfovibrionaceae bacterium]